MRLDLIKNPVRAIESAKKERSMTKTIVIAIASSIIFTIGFSAVLAVSVPVVTIGAFAGMVFLLALVAILFSGLIVQLVANTLGGKGEYFEGLATVSHATLLISIGFLISSIFSLVPFGVVISVIFFGIFFALGLAALFRGVKEFFKTDTITAFVAIVVLLLTLIMALYVGGIGTSVLENFVPQVL